MRKFIDKLLAVLVSCSLVVTLAPAAYADDPATFDPGPTIDTEEPANPSEPADWTGLPEVDTNKPAEDLPGVKDDLDDTYWYLSNDGEYYWPYGQGEAAALSKVRGDSSTAIYGIAYDFYFGFYKKSKDVNFNTVSEAISSTAANAEPIYAELKGGHKDYDWSWTLQEGYLDQDGTFKPHDSVEPIVFGPFSGDNGDSDVFTHSITAAGDKLQQNKVYQYTIKLYDRQRDLDAETSIIVTTFDCYKFRTIYESANPWRDTFIEGYVYHTPGTVPPVVASLAGQEMPATSDSVMQMRIAAASAETSESITDPFQLVLTGLENRQPGYGAYILDMDVQFKIPETYPGYADLEFTNLAAEWNEELFTIPVYRMSPDSSRVERIDAKVVPAVGEDGNAILDSTGQAAKCVRFTIRGSSASLGAFAIGYESEGTYEIESSVTEGGQITPYGINKFTLETKPQFVMYPIPGYELDYVSLKVNNRSANIDPADFVGNVYTFDPTKYGIEEDGFVEVTGHFNKVNPTQPEYNLTVTLNGRGHMDVTADFIGGTDPGTGEAVVDSTPKTINGDSGVHNLGAVSSTGGIFLEFNPDSGYRVGEVRIDNMPFRIVGSNYYIGAIDRDTTIEVTYESGFPDTASTRGVDARIVNEPDGIDTAWVLNAYGDPEKQTIKHVPTGIDTTITLQPAPEYMFRTALMYVGSSDTPTDISSMLVEGGALDTLHMYNVLNDVRVEFTYVHIDTTLTLSAGKGGTIDPAGTFRMTNGDKVRVTVKANDSYTVGRLDVDGLDFTSYLTSHNDGEYYTFMVVKRDTVDPNDGISSNGDVDRVIYVNDATAEIHASFDAVKEPAKPYLTVTTEVGGIGKGQITPDQRVEEGSTDVAVYFFPDDGYTVKKVTDNGVDVTNKLVNGKSRYNLPMIVESHHVVVYYTNGDFEMKDTPRHVIHPSASSGGFISPDVDTLVYDGQSQRFNFFPMTGYVVSKLIIDGVTVSTSEDENFDSKGYTFENVTEEHTIHVTFMKEGDVSQRDNAYTLTIIAEDHGTTSPIGTFTVGAGSSQCITLLPDQGYTVNQINVRSAKHPGSHGFNMIAGMVKGTYTQYDIQEDLVITVSFRELEEGEVWEPHDDNWETIVLHWFNADVDEGAVLMPEIEGLTFHAWVGHNYSYTAANWTVLIQDGYNLRSITYNGIDAQATNCGGGVYSFTVPREYVATTLLIEIRTDAVPESTEKVPTCAITLQTRGNGTISPSGISNIVTVETGKSQTFYFIPDGGNKLEVVYVNKVPVAITDLTYTIPSVSQNMHIEAVFTEGMQIPPAKTTREVNVYEARSEDGQTGGGFISPTTAKVFAGGSLSITFIPSQGREAKVFMGDPSLPASRDITNQLSGNTLLLSNITQDTSIYVQFNLKKSTFTKYEKVIVSYEGGGWASPSGTTEVVHGNPFNLTIMPDDKHNVDSITLNDNDITSQMSSNRTLSIASINEATHIHITFKDDPSYTETRTIHRIDASTSAGGRVSPTDLRVVNGASASFTFIPFQGYELVAVHVDGGDSSSDTGGYTIDGSTLANGVYTMSNVTADHSIVGEYRKMVEADPVLSHYTIFVNVEDAEHKLTSSDPAPGEVSPSPYVSVPAGGSQTFTFIPAPGYKMSSITWNNSQGTTTIPFTGTSYTLFNVTSDTTLLATFATSNEPYVPVVTHTITASSSVNGSISPSGATKVAEGAMSMFNMIPMDGYKLSYVVVDGTNVPASMIKLNQYIFDNVMEDHEIHAVFCSEDQDVAQFVTVVAQSPYGGSITPSGDVLVEVGKDAVFSIAPYYGYLLRGIKVNGQDFGTAPMSNSMYSWDGTYFTFKNIQEDGELSATFEKNPDVEKPAPDYTRITCIGNEPGSGGSISYNPGTSLIESLSPDEILDVSIIPDPGKSIESITLTYPDGSQETIVAPKTQEIWQKGYIELSPEQVNNGEIIVDVKFRDMTSYEKREVEEGRIVPASYHEILSTYIGHGITNAHGLLKIANGASARFTMIPDSGYELTELVADDMDKLAEVNNAKRQTYRTYTFPRGNDDDHTIFANYGAVNEDMLYYTVKTTALGDGTVSPAEFKVLAGTSATIYFFPKPADHANGVFGSKLSAIEITSPELATQYFDYSQPSYVIAKVEGDLNITAFFDTLQPGETTWTMEQIDIDAKSDGGGKVYPETASVPLGSTQKFTFEPDQGFEVDYVRFNGVSEYIPSGTYTFTAKPVKLEGSDPVNHLVVGFRPIGLDTNGEITVTATVDARQSALNDGSGTISPPQRTVPYGGNATFYIMPDPGSRIKSCTVDGYPNAYVGVDSSSGDIDLLAGGFVRGAAYDGQAVTSGGLYKGGANLRATANATYYNVYMTTLQNVTRDVDLVVQFEKIPETNYDYIEVPVHKLTVTSEGGGTVSPVGEGFLPEGKAETITLKPYSGYYLESVTITYTNEDGTTEKRDVTDYVNGTLLQLTMGGRDMHVHAKYALIGTPSFVQVEGLEAYVPVFDEHGNPVLNPDGSPQYRVVENVNVSPALTDRDGNPVNFVRGETYTFFFDTDEVGPNGRPMVLDTVTYNGKDVPVLPGTTYVTFPIDSSGKFVVKYRELREDEQQVETPGFTVTARVAEGEGTISPSGTSRVMQGGTISFGMSAGEDGWMIARLVDYYPEEGSATPVAHEIPSAQYAGGIYTLDDVSCNHEIEVYFVEVARLTVVWNNDHGFVTPNTAPGEYLYLEKGTALSFIVAPHFKYEVESVHVDDNNITGDLMQSQKTHNELSSVTGNRIIYFEDGMGVKGFNPPSSGGAGGEDDPGIGVQAIDSNAAALRGIDTTSGTAVANANSQNVGVQNSRTSFSRAYGFNTPQLGGGDHTLVATFIDDPTQDENDARHKIEGSVIGNFGGTIDPSVAYADDGGEATFTFHPADGYQVVLLTIDGNSMLYSSNSYTFRDVHGPHTIEVGFDSIAHPGSNSFISKTLRTLQSLAQTGDLNGPILLLLVVIAMVAIVVSIGSHRNTKRARRRAERNLS